MSLVFIFVPEPSRTFRARTSLAGSYALPLISPALVRAGLQVTRVCFMARSNIVQKLVHIQILSEKNSSLAEDNGITLFFFHESEIKAASYLNNLQTQSSKGIIKGQNNGKNLSQRNMKRCVNVICNQ